MDRINFFESVSGINYPKMIVDFFDHFIALKQIVEDKGKIIVLGNNGNSISFSIKFKKKNDQALALSTIGTSNMVEIYQRIIHIDIEVLSDLELKITLY